MQGLKVVLTCTIPTVVYYIYLNLNVLKGWIGSPPRSPASEGRPHRDYGGLICPSSQCSPSCFQKPCNCILCISVCLSHSHALADVRIGVEDMVTTQLRGKLYQLHLKLRESCIFPRPKWPQCLHLRKLLCTYSSTSS